MSRSTSDFLQSHAAAILRQLCEVQADRDALAEQNAKLTSRNVELEKAAAPKVEPIKAKTKRRPARTKGRRDA